MGLWHEVKKTTKKASKAWTDVRDEVYIGAGAVAGGAVGFVLGGPVGAAEGVLLGASIGVQTKSAHDQAKANQAALKEQKRANAAQEAEIDRQTKREQDQQRRENMQLMNTVSNLTNTSFGGVSSPSVDYDKYGDLG